MFSLFKKKPERITKQEWLNSLLEIDRKLFLYVESLMKDPKVEWRIYNSDDRRDKNTYLTPVKKKLAAFKITSYCIYNNDKHNTWLISIPWDDTIYKDDIYNEWYANYRAIIKKIADKRRAKEQKIIDGMKLKILRGKK